MSDLLHDLKAEFQTEDYRYGYAESFLNTKIAAQIKTLREQRGETQAEVAAKMGIKQPGYRRFEDVNHSVWKTDSLWSIARALGVRLNISFETFGSLLDEKKHFSKESLQRPKFEGDPAFKEPVADSEHASTAVAEKGLLHYLAGVRPLGTRPSWDAVLQAGNQTLFLQAKSSTRGMTLKQLAGSHEEILKGQTMNTMKVARIDSSPLFTTNIGGRKSPGIEYTPTAAQKEQAQPR